MKTIFERMRVIGAIASIGVVATGAVSFADDSDSNPNFSVQSRASYH